MLRNQVREISIDSANEKIRREAKQDAWLKDLKTKWKWPELPSKNKPPTNTRPNPVAASLDPPEGSVLKEILDQMGLGTKKKDGAW
jgi:hypothetical protein